MEYLYNYTTTIRTCPTYLNSAISLFSYRKMAYLNFEIGIIVNLLSQINYCKSLQFNETEKTKANHAINPLFEL